MSNKLIFSPYFIAILFCYYYNSRVVRKSVDNTLVGIKNA